MSTDLLNHVYATSAQVGNQRAVLLALAWKADDDGVSYPSTETLATMTAVTERTVQRSIRELVADGELEVNSGAGPHGTNLFRVIVARGRQLVLNVTPDAHVTPTPTSPNTYVPSVRISEVRGVLGDAHVTPTSAHESREMQVSAGDLWLLLRKRAGLDRFTDSKALRWLNISVGRALSSGAEWQDIEKGLRDHGRDPAANPWYADEWVRVAGADRRERENTNRKMAERAAERPRAAGLHGIGGFMQEGTR